MMKTSKIIMLSTLLGLVACSSDDTVLQEGEEGCIPITFAAIDIQEQTRATDGLLESNFDSGKDINVNIKAGSAAAVDYTFTTGSGGSMSLKETDPVQPVPYYPTGNNTTIIKVWYPANAGATFAVSSEQNVDDNYKASDLMYGKPYDTDADDYIEGCSIGKPTTNPAPAVNLKFEHLLSKVKIKLTKGTGVTSITGIQLVGVKTSVTFDSSTGTATTIDGTTGNITVASGSTDIADGTSYYSALIPAQAVDGNFLVITTSAGDATYSLTKTFAAGHQYTINLTVSSAEIGTTTAITGWSDGGTGSFPANTMQILTFNVNGAIFNMMPVEGGSYSMTYSTSASTSDDVTVTGTLSDYYIGQTEVTNYLYRTVIPGNLPSNGHTQDAYPVQCVTWDMINNASTGFLKTLNEKLATQLAAYGMSGATFVLPSEAQWQYAAMGGKKGNGYTYSGSNYLENVAWWGVGEDGTSKWYSNPSGTKKYGNSEGTTHLIGTKDANELGLYDMTGNVWEWCRDSYADIAAGNLGKDYVKTTSSTEHVIRGGGWGNITPQEYYQRVSYRDKLSATRDDVGFRLALVLQ